MKKILFIRRDNIGDLICTTPAIHAVRERFPEAKIGILVNSYNADAVLHNPDIDEVYIYEKAKHVPHKNRIIVWWNNMRVIQRIRSERYDVAIGCGSFSKRLARYTLSTGAKRRIGYSPDNTNQGFYTHPLPERKGIHEVERTFDLLAPLSIQGAPPALQAFPLTREVERAQKTVHKVHDAQNGPLIAFHISSRLPENRWPADKFIHLGKMIGAHQNVHILLLWSPGSADNPYHPGDDESAAAIRNALGATVIPYRTDRLQELIAALSIADLVVCGDGGAMHLAAALGKHIVAIWGKTDPIRWKPWGVSHILLQDVRRRAEAISVEATFSAVEKLLKPE